MAVQLPDDLWQQLEQIAQAENRTPAELLTNLLQNHTPLVETDEAAQIDAERQVLLRVYERARRYWREHDDPRAAMTDEELDEQFWLIDYDGIPRLKSERGTIDVPPSSLDLLLAEARRVHPRLTETDISERSREILNTEFADYLMRRLNGQYDE